MRAFLRFASACATSRVWLTCGAAGIICGSALQAQTSIDLRTNAVPALTAQRRVVIGGTATPRVTIGRPRFVGMRSDGGVVVADAMVPELLVFRPDGRLDHRIGQRGAGPSEFQFIAGAGLLADSVWVWDSRNARLTLFDPSGRRVADNVISVLLANQDRGTSVSILGVLDKRELVVMRDPPGTVKQGGSFTRYTYRVDPTGQRILDTIARSEIAEAFASSPRTMFMLPFTPINDGPLQSVGGGFRATVLRTAASARDRGEFTVRMEKVAGPAVGEARFIYSPIPTPRDSLRQRLGVLLTNENRRTAAARALHMTEFLPPVSALVVDQDGRVWLRREDFHRDGFEWLVLDSELRPLGAFRMPLPINGAQFPAMSFLWNHEEDSLGEPLVVGYAFPFSRTLR